ncbi:MAG TPA: hypothetical protein PLK41_04470 [Defluviitoga tunisiensis]|nr:hypothetical protein [bacterium]HPP10225.1 hypothetical protein [Defluviitoga tunisiensis]
MEKEFLDRLGQKIKGLIEKEAIKEGFDLAYYEFKVICYILDEGFNRREKIILLDTEEKNFCNFCGKKTKYYNHKFNVYLCPSCFSKVNNK